MTPGDCRTGKAPLDGTTLRTYPARPGNRVLNSIGNPMAAPLSVTAAGTAQAEGASAGNCRATHGQRVVCIACTRIAIDTTFPGTPAPVRPPPSSTILTSSRAGTSPYCPSANPPVADAPPMPEGRQWPGRPGCTGRRVPTVAMLNGASHQTRTRCLLGSPLSGTLAGRLPPRIGACGPSLSIPGMDP